MFIATISIRKGQKVATTQMSLDGGRINQTWSSHAMEYDLVFKRKERA